MHRYLPNAICVQGTQAYSTVFALKGITTSMGRPEKKGTEKGGSWLYFSLPIESEEPPEFKVCPKVLVLGSGGAKRPLWGLDHDKRQDVNMWNRGVSCTKRWVLREQVMGIKVGDPSSLVVPSCLYDPHQDGTPGLECPARSAVP